MASPFNLNIGERESEPTKSAFQESEDVAGENIHLFVQLPDRRIVEEDVKIGVNVQWVIYHVSSSTDYRFQDLDLYFEDQKLLGPLSLCDYPQIQSGAQLRLVLKDEERKD